MHSSSRTTLPLSSRRILLAAFLTLTLTFILSTVYTQRESNHEKTLIKPIAPSTLSDSTNTLIGLTQLTSVGSINSRATHTPTYTLDQSDRHRSDGIDLDELHRQQEFFCRLSPYMSLKESTEKHILYGPSLSFVMYLLPFGRDIVSTEIYAHRGWDNLKTREMLRLMQGQRPRLNYSRALSTPFVRTPKDEIAKEEAERVFVDIGANIGWFTLNMAAAGYKVISFEPLQHNEIALRSSICRNPGFVDQIRYFSFGLSGESGKCAIYSDSHNVGDGHVLCRSASELDEAKRTLALNSTSQLHEVEENSLREEEAQARERSIEIEAKRKESIAKRVIRTRLNRRLLQTQSATPDNILPPSLDEDETDKLFLINSPSPPQPSPSPSSQSPSLSSPSFAENSQPNLSRRYRRLSQANPPSLTLSLPSSSPSPSAPSSPSSSPSPSPSPSPPIPTSSSNPSQPFDLVSLKSLNKSPQVQHPSTPLSSTAMIRLRSLALTREWNTTGLIPKNYYVRNEVKLVRLDTIVREDIHLLKIDVEGFEAHVLRGSTNLFDRHHVKYIIAEYSPFMLTQKGSHPSKDFLQFFHMRGYEIRHIQNGFNIDELIHPNQFEAFCQADQKNRNRQCELFITRAEDIQR